MGRVYPRASKPEPVAPPFDEALCAARIIELREERPSITRQIAAGKLIHVVGGTVADIYRIWNEIEETRAAWRALDPADYTTVTAFKNGCIGRFLDPTTWYNGLEAEIGAESFDELKDMVAEDIV